MKKHTIFAFLMAGLVGCVGIEQYPTNSYSDENFWKYEDNCMAALYLAYNQYWNADMYFGNNILSDDVYGSRHSSNSTIRSRDSQPRTADVSPTNGTSATRSCGRSTPDSTTRTA